MPARDPAIQVGILLLFDRQRDIASDRPSAGLAGPTIGRLHQSRAAAGHHRESQTGDPRAEVPSDLIVGMPFGPPRRAEDRYARSDEMQTAKAADELAGRLEHQPQLLEPGVWPLEEREVRTSAG